MLQGILTKMDKFVILDRDGVLNHNAPAEHTYIHRLKDFKIFDYVPSCIKRLNDYGYSVVVITNQSAIAKGILKREDLKKMHELLLKKAERGGGKISRIYFCPHNTEDHCSCRKPKSGMLLRAARDFDFKLNESFYVGDAYEDVILAKRNKCRMIFILSNRGRWQIKKKEEWEYAPDYIVQDLRGAVDIIVNGVKNENTD